MIIKMLTVGPVQTNCYIVADEQTRQGAVIDPGGDAERILQAIEDLSLDIKYVLNTHGHFDHTLANGEVVEPTGADLCIHRADAPMLTQGGGAAWFGMEASSPPPTLLLSDGDTLSIGSITLEVLHTPGHSPGGCSFLDRVSDSLFSGDCLFEMGIGRTDLPGANFAQLARTLREKLMSLPDRTVVYPGHGPSTTIGRERLCNPFLT